MAPPQSDISIDPLAPIYLLVSDEPLLLARAFGDILEAAVPKNARGFNFDVVEGRGAKGQTILSMAQTLPMMAARRLVHVRNIAAMSASELAALLPYVADPNPTTVLVATAAKVDKRIKLFAALKKAKFLHELAAPRRLSGWLTDEAKRKGVRISAPARRRLYDVVGKDLSRLSLSLDQLALYAGDRAVEPADVDDLIAETREHTVFELTDAIGSGDRRAALAAVASLTDQRQSTIGVIMMLARHVRQLLLCGRALAQGGSKADIARAAKVPPFVADKLAAQARRYDQRGLTWALRRLSFADRALKGQSDRMRTLGKQLGERVLLDQLVNELIDLGELDRPGRRSA